MLAFDGSHHRAARFALQPNPSREESGVSDMPSTPIIEVEDLVKVYGKGDSTTRAVDGITFDVARGTLFGLLGPNGAGKTTTIRVLATLLDATSGRVRVDGLDVHAEPHEIRKRLGLALQTAALDAFSTGRETLVLAGRMHRLPSAEIKRRSDELLELMTLTKVANKLTGTYSGGMKRRLDLASALMHQPPLLILDEPTEGLDPQSRTALWEELERINKAGTSMLLTTHYMEEADRLCDRLAIIDNGKIVVEGSPTELKRSIGADTVVLQLDEPEDGVVERVTAHLDGVVEGLVVHPQAGGVSLAVPDAGAAIPVVMRQLDTAGIRILGLRMSHPSLDDVFLRYTGRSIREEAADGYIPMGWV
jgi:ABC-2 type transport system ATP-binding protein